MVGFVTGNNVMNFNVTQVLMQQYGDTERKWKEDYFRSDDEQQHGKLSKRRVPFVPLAIRNYSGCDLTFATMTVTSPRLILSEEYTAESRQRVSEWKRVRSGSELPFLIDEPEKSRHKVRAPAAMAHECRV